MAIYPYLAATLVEILEKGRPFPVGTLDDVLKEDPALASAYQAKLIKEDVGTAWVPLEYFRLTEAGYRSIGLEPPLSFWQAARVFLWPRADDHARYWSLRPGISGWMPKTVFRPVRFSNGSSSGWFANVYRRRGLDGKFEYRHPSRLFCDLRNNLK